MISDRINKYVLRPNMYSSTRVEMASLAGVSETFKCRTCGKLHFNFLKNGELKPGAAFHLADLDISHQKKAAAKKLRGSNSCF